MSHDGLDNYRYSLQSNFHDPVFSLHDHFGHKKINFLVIINQLVKMTDVMQPRWPSPEESWFFADGRLRAVVTDLSVITQVKKKKNRHYYKRRFPRSISRFEPTFNYRVLYTGVQQMTIDDLFPTQLVLNVLRSYLSLNNSLHTEITIYFFYSVISQFLNYLSSSATIFLKELPKPSKSI